MRVRKGIIKRIHVAQNRIKRNNKLEDNKQYEPPIICTSSDSYLHGNTIVIYDNRGIECARIIYSPEKPICSGARVWVETRNEVEVLA